MINNHEGLLGSRVGKRDGSIKSINNTIHVILKITITRSIIIKIKRIHMDEFETTSIMIIRGKRVKMDVFKKYNMTKIINFYCLRIITMISMFTTPITKIYIYDRTIKQLTTLYLWTKNKAGRTKDFQTRIIMDKIIQVFKRR